MDKYITITIDTNIKKGTFNNQETKQGLFGGKPVNRTYQTFTVDKEKLVLDTITVCNDYANRGYELISSTPIQSGIYNHDADINSGWGFGVSVTSGMVLTFKRLQ